MPKTRFAMSSIDVNVRKVHAFKVTSTYHMKVLSKAAPRHVMVDDLAKDGNLHVRLGLSNFSY